MCLLCIIFLLAYYLCVHLESHINVTMRQCDITLLEHRQLCMHHNESREYVLTQTTDNYLGLNRYHENAPDFNTI